VRAERSAQAVSFAHCWFFGLDGLSGLVIQSVVLLLLSFIEARRGEEGERRTGRRRTRLEEQCRFVSSHSLALSARLASPRRSSSWYKT
jgi:hypothetical protein